MADGFVSGHQRIAHAREVRHAASPQQALGAGTMPLKSTATIDIIGAGIRQLKRPEPKLTGLSRTTATVFIFGLHRDVSGLQVAGVQTP